MSREKFTNVNRSGKPLSDGELKERAEVKAGSVTALAERFGVKVNTASQWGRTRRIPRHLRPRIEAFISGSDYGMRQAGASQSDPPEGITPEEWNEILPLLIQLRDILRGRAVPGHEERWRLIAGNIETFASFVRRDMDAGTREHIRLKERKQARG